MKIVFMGTPDFAAASLRRLYSDGMELAAVFTQPDKPQNRGLKLTASPVKELALTHGTPVYQPATLRDGEAIQILRAINPDLIVIVAYGKLLPPDILALPRLGCINIHGSLLPKYRGSAPIQWAVLKGESITGVTSMYLAEAMDAGDIIFKRETAIREGETAGELYDRLAVLGAELLSVTIAALRSGTAPRIPQDEALVTFAPPLSKAMSPIDWTKSAREILCQIRGLNPWPVATADLGGVSFKVYKAIPGMGTGQNAPGTLIHAGREGIEVAPGSIITTGREGFEVACEGGSVIITELQAAGGKRMPASDYLRGHPIGPTPAGDTQCP
jgi:methionyl-tRNA formyltransferase